MDKRTFINGLTDPKLADKSERNHFFRNALLSLFSETPDNESAANLIEYGEVNEEECKILGLKVKGKNILLSDIMYYGIENIRAIPEEVRQGLPSLTQEDWDAATRIITLLLFSLELKQKKEKEDFIS